jgi:hypothetical protein
MSPGPNFGRFDVAGRPAGSRRRGPAPPFSNWSPAGFGGPGQRPATQRSSGKGAYFPSPDTCPSFLPNCPSGDCIDPRPASPANIRPAFMPPIPLTACPLTAPTRSHARCRPPGVRPRESLRSSPRGIRARPMNLQSKFAGGPGTSLDRWLPSAVRPQYSTAIQPPTQ